MGFRSRLGEVYARQIRNASRAVAPVAAAGAAGIGSAAAIAAGSEGSRRLRRFHRRLAPAGPAPAPPALPFIPDRALPPSRPRLRHLQRQAPDEAPATPAGAATGRILRSANILAVCANMKSEFVAGIELNVTREFGAQTARQITVKLLPPLAPTISIEYSSVAAS